jgi:hypothetical protein
MKRLLATALLLCLCSCDRLTKQKLPEDAASPFRVPTASELFDLQSKCSAMGEKLMQDNLIGSDETQSQVSHYNPKDNRCYVKLSVSTANLSAPREKYVEDDYLIDGQSKEQLAYLLVKGEKKTGMALDSSLQTLMQDKKQSFTDADAVSDLMDSFVATDRKP